MACLRLVTFFPERPDLSSPRFISCIARLTFWPAFAPYLRVDFLRAPVFFGAVAFLRVDAFLRVPVFFFWRTAKGLDLCSPACDQVVHDQNQNDE